MNNSGKKIIGCLKFLILPTLLIVAYVGFGLWARYHWGNWQISGVFGDTFGAFNALVAALALAASLYTLSVQVKQSKLAQENEKLKVQPIVIPMLQHVSVLHPEKAVMPDDTEWTVLPIVIEKEVRNVSNNPAFNIKFESYLQDSEGNIVIGTTSDSAHPYVLSGVAYQSRAKLITNSARRNLEMLRYFSQAEGSEVFLVIRIRYQNQLQGCFEVRQEFALDVKQFPDEKAQSAIHSWCNAFIPDADCNGMSTIYSFTLPSHIRMNGFSIKSISQEEYKLNQLA